MRKVRIFDAMHSPLGLVEMGEEDIKRFAFEWRLPAEQVLSSGQRHQLGLREGELIIVREWEADAEEKPEWGLTYKLIGIALVVAAVVILFGRLL